MNLKEKLKIYRLTQEELTRAESLLGRPLRDIEWCLFSALWSEHCSYKSSKVFLKKFSYKNKFVIDAEGENAGVVDIGEGERIVFKMESHNHPSFIEPYQGAATGVGGILRDIFTMGARPIALANYLCFGRPEGYPRMHELVDGVGRGLSGYGNSVGVPMIAGKTYFHSEYNKNILVNALAVGYLGRGDALAFSRARGVGNLVIYLGAKTGRDGVHGASMASESFDNDAEKKKPNVQIGDPFFEKLLIECTLEILAAGWVVAIQDMGAAGLTSSSFEMAAKGDGGVGLKLFLDRVPLRDSSITPEEILLSESQERMLLIAKPEHEESILKSARKYGLDAESIGEVTPKGEVELWYHGELLTSIDPKVLVDQAPVYERAYKVNSFKNKRDANVPSEMGFFKGSLAKLLKLAPGDFSLKDAAKTPLYEQFDQRVGLATVRGCGHPLGVLRLPQSGRKLGLALGLNPEWMRLNAWLGAMDGFLRPYLKLSLYGLLPVAATDCLNFGSALNPEVMGDFAETVDVYARLTRALEVSIVSGNVSLFNETLGQNIISTPSLGMVGVGDRELDFLKDHFVCSRAGAELFLVEFLPVKIHYRSLVHEGVFDGNRKHEDAAIGFSVSSDEAKWLGAFKVWADALRELAQHRDFYFSARLLEPEGFFKSLLKMMGPMGVSVELNEQGEALLYADLGSGVRAKAGVLPAQEGEYATPLFRVLMSGDGVRLAEELKLLRQAVGLEDLRVISLGSAFMGGAGLRLKTASGECGVEGDLLERVWGQYFEDMA